MEWVWVNLPPSMDIPFANYGDKESIIGSSSISGIHYIEKSEPEDIVILLEGITKSKISGLNCLPNAVRTPLITSELSGIVNEYATPGVQMVPTTLKLRDGVSFEYSYARPLNEASCTDIEASDITDWIVFKKRILFANRIAFREGCLGSMHFASDALTGYVVVSEELRNSLLQTGDRGLNFQRPEDVLK